MGKAILYHITAASNIESILEEGLIPNKTMGLTRRADQKPVVWLTDDGLWVARFQAGYTWCEENEAHALKIDVSSYKELLHAKISFGWLMPKVCAHEFYIEGPIAPEHILSHSPLSLKEILEVI